MKKKKLIATTLLSTFLVTGIGLPAAAAEKVTVTLPTFPVTFNENTFNPLYDEYPMIVYKDITYIPMTAEFASYMKLDTNWADQTLTVKRLRGGKNTLRWVRHTTPRQKTLKAQKVAYKVVVNGKTIDASKEQYPLLQLNDITYFPLTWRFAVEEFGWEYHFDAKDGLQIFSKKDIELHGLSDYYVFAGDVAVGYPASTFGEKYSFSYKVGDAPEKAFSLQEHLMDGDYYFDYQADQNGYSTYSKIPPAIEGNVITMYCVRQSTGKKDNILLKVDFVKGELISKTVVQL